MERLETPNLAPQESPLEGVLAEPDVQEFIKGRNIRPESYPLLVQLSQIPKDTIINGMHNFFSFNKGREALKALERSAASASTDDQRRMYELFYAFTEQYDEYASRHLVAVLERRDLPYFGKESL